MDKKEFRTRLAELVDLETVVPKITRLEEGKYDEVHDVEYEGETIQLDRAFNPTLGVRLVQLKPHVQACELGCGRMVDRQIIHRMHYQTPESHWRTKCATCGQYQHPNGKDLIDLSGTTIANTFGHYFRNKYREEYQKLIESKPRE